MDVLLTTFLLLSAHLLGMPLTCLQPAHGMACRDGADDMLSVSISSGRLLNDLLTLIPFRLVLPSYHPASSDISANLRHGNVFGRDGKAKTSRAAR